MAFKVIQGQTLWGHWKGDNVLHDAAW